VVDTVLVTPVGNVVLLTVLVKIELVVTETVLLNVLLGDNEYEGLADGVLDVELLAVPVFVNLLEYVGITVLVEQTDAVDDLELLDVAL